MKWLNEPGQWTEAGGKITITADPKTDFWRKTHDGGIRDSGHFYFETVSGDFVAEVKFSGDYRVLYDQAGLMARIDEKIWLKCGIEFFNGVQHASAVVTRDFSDWSVLPLHEPPTALWMRIVRHGGTFEVHYSFDGATYTMLRQAYLAESGAVQIGVMSCAPTGDGFTATFEGFVIRSH